MSATKLQNLIHLIDQILADYRFSIEPLRSAAIRREMARRIAAQARAVLEGK